MDIIFVPAEHAQSLANLMVPVDGCERLGVALADIPAIIEEALARPGDRRNEPQQTDGRR